MVAGSRDQWVRILAAIQRCSCTHIALSVDGQWITARKDYQEAKRRHKMKHAQDKQSTDKGPDPPLMTDDPSSTTGGAYEKDMDAMRCIPYLHGGA